MSGVPVDGEVEPEVPTPAQLKKDAGYQLDLLRSRFNRVPSVEYLGEQFVTQALVDATRDAYTAMDKVGTLYEIAKARESIFGSTENIERQREMLEMLEGIQW